MKKKAGVIIGAGKDAIHTIVKAKEQGIYVSALDGDPEAEGFLYADQAIMVDITDYHKVCHVIDTIKPDFIIPIPIGRYLLTTGYVNEKYNLMGVKYTSANISTDKYLFHKILNESGLRNVSLVIVNKHTNISEIKIPYPAILKPRFGSGSRDVFYITKEQEFLNAFHAIENTNEDFVLEQAVDGIEYSVDGAVTEGKLKITLLRKKMITPLPVRQPISSFSVVKTEENEKLLQNVQSYLQEVFQQLQYDCCLVNADLIIKEEQIFVIEAAPRPSGHNLHSVFVPLATGIDIAGEYIKLLKGETYCFEADYIRCIQIRFFDFEETVVDRVPSLKELEQNCQCNIICWNCNIRPGDYMNKVINGHSIMDRGFFIVEGKDERDLLAQSNWVLSQFEFNADHIPKSS